MDDLVEIFGFFSGTSFQFVPPPAARVPLLIHALGRYFSGFGLVV